MSWRGTAWDGLLSEVAPWVAALLEHFGRERPDADEARRLTEVGISSLTWTDDALAGISLWDRLPFNLILDAGDFFLIDYSSLVELLADIFRQVGFLGGESGNIKAANFEAAVSARARAEGFEPWKEGVELRRRDGTQRQIDVGLVAGDVLYAVECKAYAQNPKIDRGDWAARTNRQDQLVAYLDQARTLAEFIDGERHGRNYEVPEGVTTIEHMLCTPGVEFIWSRAPELWLTTTIPRICTPDELVLVLKASAAAP
jgi:hypothetical protein